MWKLRFVRLSNLAQLHSEYRAEPAKLISPSESSLSLFSWRLEHLVCEWKPARHNTELSGGISGTPAFRASPLHEGYQGDIVDAALQSPLRCGRGGRRDGVSCVAHHQHKALLWRIGNASRPPSGTSAGHLQTAPHSARTGAEQRVYWTGNCLYASFWGAYSSLPQKGKHKSPTWVNICEFVYLSAQVLIERAAH